MAYPYDMYAEILKKELGKKYLDREESNYLLNFADSSIMSSSKKIYYHALFYYKRFYPRILIHLIIKYKVKKVQKPSFLYFFNFLIIYLIQQHIPLVIPF